MKIVKVDRDSGAECQGAPEEYTWTNLHIDRYKKNDEYVSDDGDVYEDAESFYQNEVFNFCACGRPDENLEYIRDGLAHIGKERPDGAIGEEWVDRWIAEGLEIFGNQKSRYFFFYWADQVGLTEHGGSVPGWLTEFGEETLDDLNEICRRG